MLGYDSISFDSTFISRVTNIKTHQYAAQQTPWAYLMVYTGTIEWLSHCPSYVKRLFGNKTFAVVQKSTVGDCNKFMSETGLTILLKTDVWLISYYVTAPITLQFILVYLLN